MFRVVHGGLPNCEGGSSDVLFIKINTERNRGRIEEEKQKKTRPRVRSRERILSSSEPRRRTPMTRSRMSRKEERANK